MADMTLLNQAGALGSYNDQSLSLSSNLVSVIMTDGLSLTMTADQMVWADGVLTYTLVLSNASGEYAYVGPVITSVLDPTLVTLVDESVVLDGTTLVLDTDYTFDAVSGTLTVNLDDVEIGASSTLSFQVQKIA